MATTLSIAQASRASGLPADVIRYYERAGILPPVPRQANSYRGYRPEHVETLRFARRLRELGLSQEDMKALIPIFHDGTCTSMRQQLQSSVAAALERARARKAEIERAEAQLAAIAAGLAALQSQDRRISNLDTCPCATVLNTI